MLLTDGIREAQSALVLETVTRALYFATPFRSIAASRCELVVSHIESQVAVTVPGLDGVCALTR
jgi:hypothetical protein